MPSHDQVLNDLVGSTALAVFVDQRQGTASAWDRTVEGRLLTFAAGEGAAPDGGPVTIDTETGSRWSALGGVAFDGELAGTQLLQVPATPMFWFAWTDFFPDGSPWTRALD